MGQIQAGIVPVTAFQQNCTILFDSDSKHGVVVDPGGDVAAIVEALEKNDIKIDAIWLTHGHIDHAGGAMDLKEALGVEIVGPHKDDLKLLQGLEDQAQMFGVEARYAMSPLTGGSRKVKRYPSATMRSRSFIVPAMRPAT